MSIEFIKYGSTLENHDYAIQQKYVIFKYFIIVLCAVVKLWALFKSRVANPSPGQPKLRHVELPRPSNPTKILPYYIGRSFEAYEEFVWIISNREFFKTSFCVP